MDAVGLEAATSVGLSTGARVAVETALEHPRRASALVPASPVLRDQPRPPEVRRFAADVDGLFERGDIEAAMPREPRGGLEVLSASMRAPRIPDNAAEPV